MGKHQVSGRGRQAHAIPGGFECQLEDSVERPGRWSVDVRKGP